MKSKLFSADTRKNIEATVVKLLNSNQLMNYNTVNSPRAVGDAVQNFLESHISQCLPYDLVTNINTSFARRSMADLAFEDTSNNYYVVDIKTHIVSIELKNTRKKWMLQLCDALDLFYPNEITKITRRIDYFRNIREYWENQPD